MKKISLIILTCCLLILGACSKKIEKPKITISDYSTQAITAKGMVDKIMSESDYKKMHEIAQAVESSRAVSCVSVSEECNLLGKILNKIVTSTNEGLPKEDDNKAIYKMIGELESELVLGHEKLALQWSEYIKEEAVKRQEK